MADIELVNVFTVNGRGGNPCPTVLDADLMTPTDMQAIARQGGHEAGFVLSAPSDDCDYAFRFWVPKHEMEMCGHATIGALWLLASKGRLTASEIRIRTLSGIVTGFVSRLPDGSPKIEITQPAGEIQSLDKDAANEVLSVLGLSHDDLLDCPIQNAATSRVKTLVPVKDIELLNSLQPDFFAIEPICSKIGSTGLYPYAVQNTDEQIFEARQFPRASGYPEDPATGIAAAALAFGLLENGLLDQRATAIKVMQGRAMGSLSEIEVTLDFAGDKATGCRLGGAVAYAKK